MTFDKNILSILENLIPFPTFILDDEGRVVDFNQQGKKFLPDATFNTLISEVLDKEFSNTLEKLLEEAKNLDKSVKENILTDNNEEREEYEITVAPFNDEIQNSFICTIRKVTNLQNKKELQRFTIVTDEIDKIIRDEELFEIVKSVKSAYPFTFIGKAKIQKQIDMLEGYFWIKDSSRRFAIINKKFASVLGVKAKQLEGRFEKDVLPHFQNKLFATVDNYILETTNAVTVDGISSSSPYGNKPYEILEFPILDIDNNVVAIIGISQLAQVNKSKQDETKVNLPEVLKQIQIPFLLTNKQGIVTKLSSSLKDLIAGIEKFKERNIKDLLKDDELQDELSKFLRDSASKRISIKYSENVELIGLRGQLEKDAIIFLLNDIRKSDLKTSGIIKMYDAIMKLSPQAMFIYDIENLKFLEVNAAATKLYGYSRDEFLNMDLTDLYAPEDIQTLLESANKKSSSNEFTGPWRHMKKDGSSIIVEISKSQLEFKGKGAHINIVKNISEEVKNSKKIKMFKAAFENTSDLVFVLDKDGFITYASESVMRSLGYSKQELDNKPFLSLLKDDSRAEFNKDIIHSDFKEPRKIKTELKKSSGGNEEASLVATPIYDFNQDKDSITIIGKLKEKIVEVPVKSESSADQKHGVEPSFLSNVFHELLTPINVILGFIQEINDSLEQPTADQKEALDIIKQNQKLLLQTMDTAAEYSALEDNKIKFKPVEIVFVDLLEEIQNTTERTAKSNNLELTYGRISSSLKLTTDKHHFTILVTQFLKYAMQISKEDKLYLSAYTYEKETCMISVKDKREGITENLHQGLDEIFTKDEDALRKSFGFSRITTKLFRKLIELLNARKEILQRDGKAIEYGIVFPSVLEIDDTQFTEEETESEEAKERAEKLRKTLVEEVEEQKPEPAPVVEQKKEEKPEPKPEPVVKKKPEIVEEPAEPVQQSRESASSQETSAERSPVQFEALKCLYVEDQVDSQILFKVQMKDLHEIEFATSFEEALPKIKSKDYDFIVMDINLEGEYNGLDALRVIQKLPGYHNKPVIAVTAYVLPGDRDKFIAAGFSDFISKPILKDKLVNVLERIF